MSKEPGYVVLPMEKFGEGLTTSRPWNIAALAGVEQLNGRVAMLGFLAAVLGEASSLLEAAGHAPFGQQVMALGGEVR